MPRAARRVASGVVFHVTARGNGRAAVFHGAEDYEDFVKLLRLAREQTAPDLLGWCLMPNHIHLIARPLSDAALGRFMHRLLTTHGQRHRAKRATVGHIWQGRYKSFPIQEDRYFITALSYVERNSVRAGLVQQALDWRWSSLRERVNGHDAPLLAPCPVPLPEPWARTVDQPLTAAELARTRTCVRRGSPLSDIGDSPLSFTMPG